MEDEQREPPPEGAAAFLLMLRSPAVNVRLPVALIARLVDSVGCECDMCLGTLVWAKSIDTSKLDDQLRRLIEMSIANAELRLLSDRQKEEYRKIYGHKAQ